MKIVFMGTPDFAAQSLSALYETGHEIAAVFTQPDRKKGRGMALAPSPVKELAVGKSEIYQPPSLRDGEAERILREISPDIIAVVAYGQLLPPEILEIPTYGCVNIHASLLPKYRGAAPIQRAVIAGEKETGVTSMYMASELDAGDMIFAKTTEIGEYETSGELFSRLAPLGAQLLCETLDAIERGVAPRTPQEQSLVSFAPPLSKDESPINWNKSAREVISQICGLDPWPGATARLGESVYKLFSPRIADGSGKPGEILPGSDDLTVACGSGAVKLLEIQAPGKKRMRSADFMRGHSLLGQAFEIEDTN